MIQSLKSAKTATLLAGAVAGAGFCLPAAAATVTIEALDLRSSGVFNHPDAVAGTIVTAAPASFEVTYNNLDLDGDTTANDSVTFTVNWTGTGFSLFNQGAGGFGTPSIVASLSLAPGQQTTDNGDEIVFDGFTGAALGGGSGSGINATANINGEAASVIIADNPAPMTFEFGLDFVDFALSPTVTLSDAATTGSIVLRNYDLQFSTQPSVVIPEPASMALLGLGGMCLFGRRRKKA